ncbi:ABC transporter permease [Streptococcaceae bacterium ESL0729]|nr:ABC transporter permease [Streptococcaceae bacterium ESL0729]
MKYETAVKYTLIKKEISLGIFFIWWFFMGIVLPMIGILISGTTETISTDISFPVVIFSAIVLAIGSGEDFKFFIQNGLSRTNIFLVNLTSILLTSFVSSVLVLLVSSISIKNLDVSAIVMSNEFYTNNNLALNLLLMFTIIVFFSAMGLLVGTLNDMLTGIKKIIALLLAMSIPTLIVIAIQLSGKVVQKHIVEFLKYILGYSNKDMLVSTHLSITLLILTGLIFIIIFILTKNHEIRRKNA